MSTLWIREYAGVREARSVAGTAEGGSSPVPIPNEPGTDQSPVTFTGTAGQSAAFAEGTTFVRIIGNAAFHYLVASNPTATTSHLKVPADTHVDIGVRAGLKISAVAAA